MCATTSLKIWTTLLRRSGINLWILASSSNPLLLFFFVQLGPTNVVGVLLPPVLELAKDPKWRVRQNIISKSALLAKHLGVKAFEKKLQSVIIAALSDHVYSIREQCCEQVTSAVHAYFVCFVCFYALLLQVGEIVKLFGGKWATEKLFPSAFSIYDKTTNYLNRMTCLLLVQVCWFALFAVSVLL